ncbi:MAG: hypothetical protein UE295_06625 [Acutalibacteraceae bacterium]|nr:hypothetical protein [Acutalibacteraceae bacterium]
MIRVFRSRRTTGVLFLIAAVMFLVSGISTTLKLNGELDDYHALTSESIKLGDMYKGNIDEWAGPVARSDDGAYIYFLLLDNKEIIPFKTYDDAQKDIFASYDETKSENQEVEFIGRVKNMQYEDKQILLGALGDMNYSQDEARECFIPYYLSNVKPGSNKYAYILAAVFGGVGILLFLPEYYSALAGKKGVREAEFKVNYHNSTASNGYNNTYAGSYKTYAGTQNNTYGNSSAQQYGQSNTAQQPHTAQGQNREYAGTSYTGQYSNAQGQNREYAGTSYTGQYSNAQGQNRAYTAQGQNREYAGTSYAGQYSNAQGQNRNYTADSINSEYNTSDKANDNTDPWNKDDAENKSTEW